MVSTPSLDEEDHKVLAKVLASDEVQNEIGAENWNLSEEDEERLWKIIERYKDSYG